MPSPSDAPVPDSSDLDEDLALEVAIRAARAGGELAGLMLPVFAEQVVECTTMGSLALGLCYVAAGRLHAYWHLDPRIWDVAAASLIVQRAGGTLTDANGVTWLYSDGGYIASNSIIHGWTPRVITAVMMQPRTSALVEQAEQARRQASPPPRT